MLENEFKKRLLDALPEASLLPFVQQKAVAREKDWLEAMLNWDYLNIREIEYANDENTLEHAISHWEKRVATLTSFVQADVLVGKDGATIDPSDENSEQRQIAIFSVSEIQRDGYLSLLREIFRTAKEVENHRCFSAIDTDLGMFLETSVNLSKACCALNFPSLLREIVEAWPRALDYQICAHNNEDLLFKHINDGDPVSLQMYAFQFSSVACYKVIHEAWKGEGPVPLKYVFLDDDSGTTPKVLLDNMSGQHFPMYCKAEAFLAMLEIEAEGKHDFHSAVSEIFCNTESRPDLADCVSHMLDQKFFDKSPLLHLTAAVEWGHAEAVRRIVIEKDVLAEAIKTDENPAIKVLKFIISSQKQGNEDILESGKYDKSLIAFNEKLAAMGLSDKIFDSIPRRKLSFPQPLRSMLKSGRKEIIISVLKMGLQPREPIREGKMSPIDFAKSLNTKHAGIGVDIMTSWNARALAHSIIDSMESFKVKKPNTQNKA